MKPGNAPHNPDTASSTIKATKKKEKKGKKKGNLWSAFILFVFIAFGFITIGHYNGWQTGLILFVADATISPLLVLVLQKSSLKYRYYIQTILITLAVLAPTTYSLYKIGGILALLGGYATFIILIVLGEKKTLKNK